MPAPHGLHPLAKALLIRRSFRSTLPALCAMALTLPMIGQAQAAAVAINIPAQSLGSALQEFGRQTNLQVISDQVLLYKVSNRLVYKNEVFGRCTGLSRGDTLITQSFTGQLCRGDIARVANLNIGMLSGSCALGDFVPYRTPGK